MAGIGTGLDRYMRESYTAQADEYDRVRYLTWEGSYFADLEMQMLRPWIGDASSIRLLDVPAGTGRATIPLAEMGAQVHGVDLTERMLRKAMEKAAARRVGKIGFRLANARQLPFATGTFDIVTSFKFFHLVPNDQKRLFLQEMSRVLKPGGRLIIELNSGLYGLVLAVTRHLLFKRGRVSQACIFPRRLNTLFVGMNVRRTMGVKLPLSGLLSRIFGTRVVTALNRAAGRMPGIKWLCYVIIVEAEKPLDAR